MVEAINDAFHVELARDDDVLVLGEDVGRAGGVFRATAGLRERFGENRCVDTPLAEAGILGDDLDATIRQEAADAMRAAIAEAEAEPAADVGLLFKHTYANPPESFAAELADLRRVLGGDVG